MNVLLTLLSREFFFKSWCESRDYDYAASHKDEDVRAAFRNYLDWNGVAF